MAEKRITTRGTELSAGVYELDELQADDRIDPRTLGPQIIYVVADTTARDALTVPAYSYAYLLSDGGFDVYDGVTWANSTDPGWMQWIGTATAATVATSTGSGFRPYIYDQREV